MDCFILFWSQIEFVEILVVQYLFGLAYQDPDMLWKKSMKTCPNNEERKKPGSSNGYLGTHLIRRHFIFILFNGMLFQYALIVIYTFMNSLHVL